MTTILTSDGRAVGERGRLTRRALLDCLPAQLDATGYRDLGVADVARAAGTSPATFYQYFASVEDALYVLAEEAADAAASHPVLRETLPHWDGRDAAPAMGMTDAFFGLYAEHRPVLRAVEVRADEGDQRFAAVRNRFLDSLRAPLALAVAHGRPGATAHEHAATTELLVAMLAAVAAQEQDATGWPVEAAPKRAFTARALHEIVTTTITT